jgi:hypothetical protein
MSVTQYKICVEKILPHHQDEYDNLKMQSNSESHFQKLHAAFITKKIWPQDSKIRIAFTESGNNIKRTSISSIEQSSKKSEIPLKIDPLQEVVDSMTIQEAVKKIVKERIIPIVGLDIDFVENINDANVKVSFDPEGGAWSLVGTDCLYEKGPTMNLGWFDVATTIHEFGHCMGMIHEHQNPSANPIEWNENAVYNWAKTTQGWDEQTTENNIINRYSISQINGSKFDPLSIMLYFFPAELTTNNQGTHENLRLSGYDVEYLSSIYPKSNMKPDQFYEEIYHQSLESAKKDSKLGDSSSSSKEGKSIWIGLIILLSVVILGLLIWKNSKKSL